jgi:hypothetical protein
MKTNPRSSKSAPNWLGYGDFCFGGWGSLRCPQKESKWVKKLPPLQIRILGTQTVTNLPLAKFIHAMPTDLHLGLHYAAPSAPFWAPAAPSKAPSAKVRAPPWTCTSFFFHWFLADHFLMKWSAIVVVQCVRVSVCPSVCPYRELWPDRSRHEHPVWSKRCSIHPDMRHKKPHPKIPPSSPLFWGWNGKGVWQLWKKCTKVRLSRALRKILMFCLHTCVAPT